MTTKIIHGDKSKIILRDKVRNAVAAPVSVTGSRSDPEQALANLLTVLATKGIIIDNTTP